MLAKPMFITCAIQRLSVGTSFSIVYGALFTKTNRISRIFNSASRSAKRPSFISPKSQLVMTSCIVSFQVYFTLHILNSLNFLRLLQIHRSIRWNNQHRSSSYSRLKISGIQQICHINSRHFQLRYRYAKYLIEITLNLNTKIAELKKRKEVTKFFTRIN